MAFVRHSQSRNRGTVTGMWLVAALVAMATAVQGQSVGQPLPKWTPGTLDIHQINTGRGNAAFLMLPDGTTMLVDAGNGGNLPPRGTPPKPDASRTARRVDRALRHGDGRDRDRLRLSHALPRRPHERARRRRGRVSDSHDARSRLARL